MSLVQVPLSSGEEYIPEDKVYDEVFTNNNIYDIICAARQGKAKSLWNIGDYKVVSVKCYTYTPNQECRGIALGPNVKYTVVDIGDSSIKFRFEIDMHCYIYYCAPDYIFKIVYYGIGKQLHFPINCLSYEVYTDINRHTKKEKTLLIDIEF